MQVESSPRGGVKRRMMSSSDEIHIHYRRRVLHREHDVMPSPYDRLYVGAGAPENILERIHSECGGGRVLHPATSPDCQDSDAAESSDVSTGDLSVHGPTTTTSPATTACADSTGADASASASSAARSPIAGEPSGYSGFSLRSMKENFIIVSNRLPVSATRGKDGQWSLETSSGGLVSALIGVKDVNAKWIGRAGVDVPDEAGRRSLTEALAKEIIPVFLDEELAKQYYNGYCNNALWPLGLPQELKLATTKNSESQCEAYKSANQMFADVVPQHCGGGDVVWIHDFHLMYLPEYLRKSDKDLKIGWFMHTPFPSSEIYKTLSGRMEVLRASLVG